METLLFAVLGTSPGILTETVWALARHPAQPVVPDEVWVVTTSTGRDMARKELLTPDPLYGGSTVWEAMKRQLAAQGLETAGKLRFGQACISVFPNADANGHLADIRTAADNDLAADFLLREVRRLQGQDNRLIGSVAGGRKTMSTLLYAVFSLVGRTQDRLTHVLVNDPFESPGLDPRFYFPCTPPLLHQGRNREGKVVREAASDKAVMELADIPFVRMRRLFPKDFKELPGRFTTLVAQYNEPGSARVQISFNDDEGTAVINGTRVRFGPRDHALFAFLTDLATEGKPPCKGAQDDAAAEVHAFVQGWLQRHPEIASESKNRTWVKDFSADELRGALGQVRDVLRAAGLKDECKLLLRPRGPAGWDPALTDIEMSDTAAPPSSADV